MKLRDELAILIQGGTTQRGGRMIRIEHISASAAHGLICTLFMPGCCRFGAIRDKIRIRVKTGHSSITVS
jgi:hypothetical protein